MFKYKLYEYVRCKSKHHDYGRGFIMSIEESKPYNRYLIKLEDNNFMTLMFEDEILNIPNACKFILEEKK